MASKPSGVRKYSAAACLSCKKRKVRCDNGKPRCSNCVLYDVECVFGDDGRRTSSTTKAISALKARVQELEGELRRSQVNDQPDSDSQRGEQSKHNVAGSREQQQPLPSQSISHTENDDNEGLLWNDSSMISPNSAMDASVMWNMEDPQTNWTGPVDFHGHDSNLFMVERPFFGVPLLHQAIELPQLSPLTSHPDSEIGNASQGGNTPSKTETDEHVDLSEDELASQLSTTTGFYKTGEDGHMRYYGATSTLRMTKESPLSLYSPAIRPVRSDGARNIEQAGLSWDKDADFEEHLTKLYFTWHNPFIHEVDETMYRRDREVWRAGEDTPFFSPGLENSILTTGALYSSRTHPGISGPVSEFFNARARIYLDLEMDSPSLATAQAFLVLAAHEAANCRDSRAWLYNGMAVQLITDLGLHVDAQRERQRSDGSTDDHSITNFRHRLFWAVYMDDSFYSSYHGRPSLMFNMKVHVPGPVPSTCAEWKPYWDFEERSDAVGQFDEQQLRQIPVYVAQLAMKLGRIQGQLYHATPDKSDKTLASVLAMTNDLASWHASLPSTISPEMAALPFVVILHLLFHEGIIFLHRPFLADARPIFAGNMTASQLCSNAAVEICRLLETSKAKYPLKYLNGSAVRIVIAAGTIHAYDSVVYSGPRGKQAQGHFLSAVRLLGELGTTFNSATRGLEIITSLRSEWQARRFQQSKGKRKRLGSIKQSNG
ncbi:fungal-specific transcription factor domain-containing protein [Neohortaea acidophila]|uniref:Fungal-specific transcription factor domain-containing protein n=1 Tax=Neohortaea acidophila TaxID=245834 RepID=A0A6A6PY69_9PEZI|nr:fungal-specific transcription factor domain-containing protein [Neohortaea acidophila]KAF2484935.1 fungal-specific transcription factor domain-containing protein [Neohortaea acidophila]